LIFFFLQEKIMASNLIRAVLICVLLLNTSFAQSLRLDFKKVDSLFTDWQKPKSPGGVVAIMRGEEVIYKKAFGLADVNRGIANSFKYKYDIASIAKQFTGMCIALLQEQDKISTEDNLSKFYPDFQMTAGIKIKNLLDHTSGIREAYVLATLSGKINLKGEVRKKFNTKENLINVLKKEKDLNFKTGEELAYTNINYILLADIVEKVISKPFYEFADSAIFKPLHMNETVFRYKDKMKIPFEANGYLLKGKKFKKRKGSGGVLGDGKLLTTIDDLVKWEINLRHNILGKANPGLADKLYTSSYFNNGELTHYGYGFWITEYSGLKQINHGGDDGRFTSFILKFPEQNLAILLLANSSRYSDTNEKAYKIGDILLKEFFPTPSANPKAFNFISATTNDKRKLPGLYKHLSKSGLAKLRKISVVKDSLFIAASYYGKGINLKKITDTNFFAITDSGKRIYFKVDSTNHTFEEQFEGSEPVRFELVEKPDTLLKDYLGKYFNESTGAKLKITQSKNSVVAHKGIIRIPLTQFDQDQFYAFNNDALFIFQRSEKGQINSLKINASDFRNFIFKKIK
jgi:CubicO group peptidase (beta-lactamase class C family)